MNDSERGEMPLADYDHLPIGPLKDRVRSLSGEEVRRLLDYEREHANRTPVTSVLISRLEQLEDGAEPSGGGHDARSEQPSPRRGGSPVTPATSPEPIHPPPHGHPGTPGKPKGDRTIGD